MESTTILIVDDSPDDYEPIVRSFKKARIRNPVHWCQSGKEALNYLKTGDAHTGASRPGLLLLDLNMPGLDGKKTLSLIKQDPALKL